MNVPSPKTPRIDWQGACVLVAGLGRFGGGAGAVRYFAERGARVLVTDMAAPETLATSLATLADLEFETVLGEHRREDFERAELVVANPGMRPDHELLTAARAAGAVVTSEVELFLERASAPFVAVSGTQGKSSTVTMLADLLRAAGRRVHLGGNVGGSLLSALDESPDLFVLELSSYQLEALGPDVGTRVEARAVALTNVLADHLERHGSLDRYRSAKARILELAQEPTHRFLPVGLFPARAARRFRAEASDEAELTITRGQFRYGTTVLGEVRDLPLPAFQRENALVALGLAFELGVEAQTLAATLGTLTAPEHRMQDLEPHRGRRIVDNGVSTTPDSTISALELLPAKTVLLVGGKAKDLPLDQLVELAERRETHVVAFGADGPRLARVLNEGGARAELVVDFDRAVERAVRRTPIGGTLLFSPACASFDAFSNFRERALRFRETLRATN